jgi:hypothetical protein
MRRSAALVAIVLLSATGCSGGLIEVPGYLGIMDCPSEFYQHSTGDFGADARGSATAQEALAMLTADMGLPPGTPQVESEAPDEVIYLFTSSEGHRLGRVLAIRLQTGGWGVADTERCG